MSIADLISDSGRSFAEELRSRSDEELIALFQARPDLITPIPADMNSLAARATSAPSLTRAIESLNQWQLQVLEICSLMDGSFAANEIVQLSEKAASQTIAQLTEWALLYRDGKKFRTPRAVREILGESVAGLGPNLARPVDMKMLEQAPEKARDLLALLTWGPPRGQIDDVAKKGPAIEWLLNNHYLIPIDSKTVALPREIAIYLRGGKIHKERFVVEPPIQLRAVKLADVDRAAIASIATLLRLIGELANFWAEETPSAIQSGGLGVRDLKKASEHLGIDEPFTAFVAEVCYQIGIITVEADSKILPTALFDIFQTKSPEEQWREVTDVWRISSRVSGLVGRSDSRNINALGGELNRSNAARIRSIVLRIFKDQSGQEIELSSLIKAVSWNYPHRRSISMTEEMVRWTVREAEWLGITGAQSLSSFGAKYLAGEKKLGISSALPAPVDHILIQGDNTAIAPGPLQVEISRQLSNFADIESRGSATVYRFTESSIRRGLDHGHSGDEIRKFLAEISKTPVPQPLDYLVADVAKKHGRLRVGSATTYIRCEDENILKAIVNDKRLDHLRLHQIAPQVIIGDGDAADILADLRDAGYFPAVENSEGKVLQGNLISRAKSRPRPPRVLSEVNRPAEEIMKVAIKTLRVGERATVRRPSGEIPRNTAAETLELITEYLGKGIALRIGYADTNGAVSIRIIDPLTLSMGTLIARDHLTNGITPFKIARITGVTVE